VTAIQRFRGTLNYAANVLQRFDEQFECEDATDELASLQAVEVERRLGHL
jgi:hypothetical protein